MIIKKISIFLISFLFLAQASSAINEDVSELENLFTKITVKDKYKSRLFLGEADFSYTYALIKKHKSKMPGLGEFITATELVEKDILLEEYDKFNVHLSFIEENNLTSSPA